MNALYYREHYYLLPEKHESFDSFIEELKNSQFPAEIFTYEMHENYELKGPVNKGISFAPYFIDGYNVNTQSIIIENINEVYPADIEVISQDEYNARLRKVIEEYCPGCIFYKPLSKNVRSLNGHFDEISLDKLCFVRQEQKPSPNYFLSFLRALGGYWYYHESPDGTTADSIARSINNWLKLKYDKAEYSSNEDNTLILTHKKDFFIKVLTALINEYTATWITTTKLRIKSSDESEITENDILDIISSKNAEKLRKSCKKYGISIGILEFDKEAKEEIETALSDPTRHNLFYPIFKKENKIYYIFTDTPINLKMLHFRHPMLQIKNAKVTIYSQYGVKEYKITRYMPSFSIE